MLKYHHKIKTHDGRYYKYLGNLLNH